MGNGICDDETNNVECMFDDLDCCGYYYDENYYDHIGPQWIDDVDRTYCYDCICHGM